MSKGSSNKGMLIGNLGSDPELRFTPSGVQVANFSLATTESWTDKSGERQERAEWHRIVLWRRLAEVGAPHWFHQVRSQSEHITERLNHLVPGQVIPPGYVDHSRRALLRQSTDPRHQVGQPGRVRPLVGHHLDRFTLLQCAQGPGHEIRPHSGLESEKDRRPNHTGFAF